MPTTAQAITEIPATLIKTAQARNVNQESQISQNLQILTIHQRQPADQDDQSGYQEKERLAVQSARWPVWS
jgi:hypothetical protein